MANSQIKSPDWILLVGQLLAQLSDKMLSIGLIWIIAKNFGDTWVTWYLVVGGIPHLIFFSLNAKLIQKIGALKVVIATDWIRAIIYFVASLIISNVEHKSELPSSSPPRIWASAYTNPRSNSERRALLNVGSMLMP